MAKKRILFVNQEIAPYSPDSAEAEKGKKIPVAMQQNGYEVRTFMPKFGAVNERRNQLHEVIRLSGMNIVINDNDHPLIIKVASMQPSRIQVYFIDNDDYFQKEDTDIDISGSNRPDNDERAIFFARGTVETMKKLRWEPTILQCSGWMTALVPVYLREQTGEAHVYKNSKVVYTVTEHKLEAPLSPAIMEKLQNDKIASRLLREYKDAEPNTELLHRLAISTADAVIFDMPRMPRALFNMVRSRKIPYISRKDLAKGPEAYLEFYNSLTADEN